ncbi:MAG: phosphate ABC transporter substrate-binding protein PstS [Acidimicrobiaceae bacterium]|nr:phosphate ABC transporter substrate-binding protein PstS [Acidimicrobiaceae bacterium]
MSFRRPLALAATSILGVALAGCGSSSSSSTTTSPTTSQASSQTTSSPSTTAGPSFASLETPPSGNVALQETGSTLLYPLFNLWSPAYSKQYSNITITTAGTGSGTGIADAASGTVDIGASDAYLSPTLLSQTPTLLNIPLAISAQMINYNLPGVTTPLKLNGQILSAIYQGKITTWNASAIAAANPGVTLPSTKIVPLHRSDGSGDTFIFTQYLSKSDPSGWGSANGPGFGTTVSFPAVPGALAETGNGGMVSGCAATPGCIAYIGVSFRAQTQTAKLGEALLQNASGNYEPLNATTINAEAAGLTSQTPANETLSLVYGPAQDGYPIINYEYAIVNSKQADPNKAQAIKSLLAWALDPQYGNSATYLGQVNFQPLPSAVATLSLTQIAKIGS